MKKLMTFAAAFLTAATVLTSCSRYLKIGFNKYTRVYLPGLTYSGEGDCYSLYASDNSRFFRAGSRTYFFAPSPADVNGKVSPALVFLQKNSIKAEPVCTDPECVHNDRVNFTKRCILCDISDYRYTAVNEGKLYFARANRANRDGGFDYCHSDGTDLSEADTETFLGQSFWTSGDEREVPWEIISYDLATGEHEVIYSVPAGQYLDRAVYHDGSLYFTETYYARRANLKNTGDDADFFYFTDTDTDTEGITYPARHFYTHLTLRREKTDYYLRLINDPESGVTEEPANTGANLVNLRYNRKYYVDDDGCLNEKVYAVKRYDLKGKTLSDVIPELKYEPEELLAWEGRLYTFDRERLYFIDISSGQTVTLLDFAENGIDQTGVSSLQLDSPTDMLWFRNGGAVSRLKVYEDRGVYYGEPPLGAEGELSGYQLTADGIYVLTVPGGVYYVRWNELERGIMNRIYSPSEPDFAAASVNAAGSYVYMNIERSNGKDFYYEYYRLKLEVSVTEYESVDPDAAGAGISGYKIDVKSDRITGTR